MPVLIDTQFLDGTLAGPRIMESELCTMYISPRNSILEVSKEMPSRHCLYILTGKFNQSDAKAAYIGQTKDFQQRVKGHLTNKGFWDTAIVCFSNADRVYASEALFLEYLAIKNALESGSFRMDENIQIPPKPHIHHPKEVEMSAFFEEIRFFLLFYGCAIFEKQDKREAAKNSAGGNRTQKVEPVPDNINPQNLTEVHSTDDLPKGARYSLDGENYVSMAKFGFLFMKRLLTDKSLSFQELEALFPKRMLGGFQCCGVVAKQDVVDKASYSLADKKKRYRYGDAEYLLRSADGSVFYTSTQWERESFKKLLSIAEQQGYRVFIAPKE